MRDLLPKNVMKKLLGLKPLRRSLSVLVLASLDAAALVLGLLGALRLPGVAAERVVSLAPLLVGVWVVVFAAFRLYDRAPVRRNPGAFIGASFCWAGLALAGAAAYPESGLGPAGVPVAGAPPPAPAPAPRPPRPRSPAPPAPARAASRPRSSPSPARSLCSPPPR